MAPDTANYFEDFSMWRPGKKIKFGLITFFIILALAAGTYFALFPATGENDIKPFWSDVFGNCVEKWECGDWSPCVNGIRTRMCTDLNVCYTQENLPSLEMECQPVADIAEYGPYIYNIDDFYYSGYGTLIYNFTQYKVDKSEEYGYNDLYISAITENETERPFLVMAVVSTGNAVFISDREEEPHFRDLTGYSLVEKNEYGSYSIRMESEDYGFVFIQKNGFFVELSYDIDDERKANNLSELFVNRTSLPR